MSAVVTSRPAPPEPAARKAARRLPIPSAPESGTRLVHQYSDEPAEVQDEPAYAMSVNEIAAELGISKQAVMQVLERGLRKLRRHPAALRMLREYGR